MKNKLNSILLEVSVYITQKTKIYSYAQQQTYTKKKSKPVNNIGENMHPRKTVSKPNQY